MSELIKKEQQAVSRQAAPARGFDDIDNNDLTIPQACIAQGLSQVITDGVEGIKIGTIYNNLTNEVMPKVFVPILATKVWIKFEDGEMVYRATSPQDENVINDPEAWRAERIQILALFEGQAFPTIIQFGGASAKIGKKFVTKMKFRGEDMFARSYILESEMQKNNKGTFGVFKVSENEATDPATFNKCEAIYNNFINKAKDIVAHESNDRAPESVLEYDNGEVSPY